MYLAIEFSNSKYIHFVDLEAFYNSTPIIFNSH